MKNKNKNKNKKSKNVVAHRRRVDESNPRNTDDFKYRAYKERPPMVHVSDGGKHKSLMCKHLTPELFEKLKDVKTSKGYTLSNAIQTGVMTPHLGVGITAGDEESWELFKEILYPVIKGWHGLTRDAEAHERPQPRKCHADPEMLEKFSKYVASTRIRAARNVPGFALPAGTTRDRCSVQSAPEGILDLEGTSRNLLRP